MVIKGHLYFTHPTDWIVEKITCYNHVHINMLNVLIWIAKKWTLSYPCALECYMYMYVIRTGDGMYLDFLLSVVMLTPYVL